MCGHTKKLCKASSCLFEVLLSEVISRKAYNFMLQGVKPVATPMSLAVEVVFVLRSQSFNCAKVSTSAIEQ